MASGNSMYTKKDYPNAAQSTLDILNKNNYSGSSASASNGTLASGTAQSAIKADLAGQTSAREALDRYYKDNPPKNTGGGSSNNNSAAYSGGDSSFDLAGYLAQINAQRQAAADAAFDRAAAALNSAYGEAQGSYGNIYNSGVSQLGKTYDNSRGKIRDEATDAFRQAYVNRMIGEKNLSQRLAALGISGGLSESSLAGITNSYDKARSRVQNTMDTNLGDLEMKYQGNLADLYNAYQSQLASLASNRASQLAQLEMNRANQIASAGGDYFSALMSNSALLNNAMKNAVASQNAYAPTAQEVTNLNNAVATTQANDMGGTGSNWTAWQKYLMDQLNTGGSNIEGAVAPLKGQATADQIAEYLNYLGIGA